MRSVFNPDASTSARRGGRHADVRNPSCACSNVCATSLALEHSASRWRIVAYGQGIPKGIPSPSCRARWRRRIGYRRHAALVPHAVSRRLRFGAIRLTGMVEEVEPSLDFGALAKGLPPMWPGLLVKDTISCASSGYCCSRCRKLGRDGSILQCLSERRCVPKTNRGRPGFSI